jgi:hypothetical protein
MMDAHMRFKQIPENIQVAMRELRMSESQLLGSGGEGFIFDCGNELVVKIYRSTDRLYLENLKDLQSLISGKKLPFATPQILEIGNVGETFYTRERKLPGVLMEDKFPALSGKEQDKLLNSYYDAISALNDIELPDFPFGGILRTPEQITAVTWPGFLTKTIDRRVEIGGGRLEKDVKDLGSKVQTLSKIIRNELVVEKKSLVHADYFVNQVLVSDNNEISAVLDISGHAVAGDRRLDVAGVWFFEGMPHYTQRHRELLLSRSIEDFGEEILRVNDIYRLYYCFYFSDVYEILPQWYQTLMKNLNDGKIWARLGLDN